VKPRSLRPAVSPEQIEKLRRADDRPTKYHSDVAVLIVDDTVGQEDIVVRENAEKIETFFKDLNSQNEVTIISLASSQGTREFMSDQKERYYRIEDCRVTEERLERVLQRQAHLEKELEKVMQMEKGRKQRRRPELELELELSNIKQQELWLRCELENVAKAAKRDIEKLKELEKESTKAISTAMDKWIHSQEKFTCVVVFIIGEDELYTEANLEECVVEKLALIPDHAKLVVSPLAGWKSIAKVPETLHIVYRDRGIVPVLTRMIEIFNKRWQTLDLISMMQELKRTEDYQSKIFRVKGFQSKYYRGPSMSIKVDSLSSLPTFQKTEEEHSF